MNLIKRMAKDLGVLFIRAFKFNLGINGDTWDYDGYVPDGIGAAMILNPLLAFGLGVFYHIGPDHIQVFVMLSVLYTFLMGFFGFPMIKCYLGIQFPSGNGFYWPERLPTKNDVTLE